MWLLRAHANVNIQNNKDRDTALILWAKYGHYRIMHRLLDAEPLINKKSSLGYNVLMYVAQHGWTKMISRLILMNVDINNNDGIRAINLAIEKGNKETAHRALNEILENHMIPRDVKANN